MTSPPDSQLDPLAENDCPSSPAESAVGYKKPPRHTQFKKGQSGNPKGRPKRPIGTSIKSFLDGSETGKNGEVVSRREAMAIALVNSALEGNPKAFSLFMKFLNTSGLLRKERENQPMHVFYKAKRLTPDEYEEFKLNFGRKPGEPWKTIVKSGGSHEQG
ncbi:MAG: DUF5681 domain-containing protein [Afipia sp.]